mgnify:FL=1
MDDDSYMDSFELSIQIQTLKQRVQEYMIEEAMAEMQKAESAEAIAKHNEIAISKDASYLDKFEAVMTGLLANTDLASLGELDDESEEKPTDDY